MDSDEFREILSRSGVGIWSMIDAAIRVASSDYGEELRRRRDEIVASLYALPSHLCRNCGGGNGGGVDKERQFRSRSENGDYLENKEDNPVKAHKLDDHRGYGGKRDLSKGYSRSPLTPESNTQNFSGGGGDEAEDMDPYGGLFDDEQTRILSIKEQLEDPHQSEDAVIELLQNLSDMDITFQALKETEIGRHVSRLRKHESGEVCRMVKLLVRKWKETVDEWVKVHQPPQAISNIIGDVDSPQQNIQKFQQNGHQQVLDFGYSPNPTNRSSSSEMNHAEYEPKSKQLHSAPRRETTSKSVGKSSSAPPPPPPSVPNSQKDRKGPILDDERLNSARRRLHENYQEAENAKRQRTIQVMDIHEIPKPKKTFSSKHKVGGFHGRHTR